MKIGIPDQAGFRMNFGCLVVECSSSLHYLVLRSFLFVFVHWSITTNTKKIYVNDVIVSQKGFNRLHYEKGIKQKKKLVSTILFLILFVSFQLFLNNYDVGSRKLCCLLTNSTIDIPSFLTLNNIVETTNKPMETTVPRVETFTFVLCPKI